MADSIPYLQPSTFNCGVQLGARRKQLRHMAAAFGLSFFEAEDLVQETLLKAFLASQRFPEQNQSKSWVRRVMRNTLIDRYRRLQTEKNALSRLRLESVLPARWVEPHSKVNNGVGDEVQRALGQLPEHLRLAVQCVDLQGLSYQQTAVQCEIPVGTVLSRLHRARRVLKGRLGRYMHGLGFHKEAA